MNKSFNSIPVFLLLYVNSHPSRRQFRNIVASFSGMWRLAVYNEHYMEMQYDRAHIYMCAGTQVYEKYHKRYMSSVSYD